MLLNITIIKDICSERRACESTENNSEVGQPVGQGWWSGGE